MSLFTDLYNNITDVFGRTKEGGYFDLPKQAPRPRPTQSTLTGKVKVVVALAVAALASGADGSATGADGKGPMQRISNTADAMNLLACQAADSVPKDDEAWDAFGVNTFSVCTVGTSGGLSWLDAASDQTVLGGEVFPGSRDDTVVRFQNAGYRVAVVKPCSLCGGDNLYWRSQLWSAQQPPPGYVLVDTMVIDCLNRLRPPPADVQVTGLASLGLNILGKEIIPVGSIAKLFETPASESAVMMIFAKPENRAQVLTATRAIAGADKSAPENVLLTKPMGNGFTVNPISDGKVRTALANLVTKWSGVDGIGKVVGSVESVISGLFNGSGKFELVLDGDTELSGFESALTFTDGGKVYSLGFTRDAQAFTIDSTVVAIVNGMIGGLTSVSVPKEILDAVALATGSNKETWAAAASAAANSFPGVMSKILDLETPYAVASAFARVIAASPTVSLALKQSVLPNILAQVASEINNNILHVTGIGVHTPVGGLGRTHVQPSIEWDRTVGNAADDTYVVSSEGQATIAEVVDENDNETDSDSVGSEVVVELDENDDETDSDSVGSEVVVELDENDDETDSDSVRSEVVGELDENDDETDGEVVGGELTGQLAYGNTIRRPEEWIQTNGDWSTNPRIAGFFATVLAGFIQRAWDNRRGGMHVAMPSVRPNQPHTPAHACRL